MITQQWAPSPHQPAGDGTEVAEYWSAAGGDRLDGGVFPRLTGGDRT
jgi:hypothetical protein